MPAMRFRGILAVALLAVADVASALPCEVVSTNDGNGLFTYTFQRGDTPYVWGLNTNGSIILQAYGVLEVHTPSGWTHSSTSADSIIFIPTHGTNFLDEPVTFSVRSCLTDSARYEGAFQLYPPGIILGVVYALPERTEMLGGGYQNFSYIGPGLPHLTIERNGADVLIRWPASALSLTVETSDLMPASPWTPLADMPALSGSSWTIGIRPGNSPQFFRLVTPCSP